MEIGPIEEPIMTLDLAQRIGLKVARDNLAKALKEAAAAQELLNNVILSVGLLLELEYPIDAEGRVFKGVPKEVNDVR